MTHPTPWNGMKLPIKYDPDNLAIMDARGFAIVAVESNQVEWAKAVCIAVNAHDELVEALQDLHLESTETYGHWPEMKIQVEAALKKAGAA